MIHSPVPAIELLLSPLEVGPLTLKNRICMPAMHLNYTMGGEVSDQLVDFYAERARGGVALITVGGCSVDTVGGGPILIGLHEDRFLPGLQRLVEAIHEGGALAIAQLYQAGKYAYSMITGQQAVSASAIRSKLTKETPRALEREEIPVVQEAFRSAAGRAITAGFDGVEVLAAAGYLISQFLSPVSNKREDGYGGCFANRARFGREIVEQVRAEVGSERALIVRVAGSDYVPGGHVNEYSARASALFAAAGADAINVTGGWHETRVPQITMGVPRGAFLYLARGIRDAVSVPVIASNRCNDPFLAEAALRDGMADLVNFGRPLIADPDLPLKLAEGRPDRVVHCIACNQGCFDHVFEVRPVSCMVNPRAGQEARMVVAPAAEQRRVLVVGGGPGGMTAAITAARRGHSVTLLERSDRLGGQLLLAAAVPGREELGLLVDDLRRQLAEAGVTAELRTEATVERVRAAGADRVIVATGARPARSLLPGAERANVASAWDVLAGRALLGRQVVVVGGGAVAVDVALSVAQRGTIDAATLRFLLVSNAEPPERLRGLCVGGTHRVTLVEMTEKIGSGIGRSTRWTLTQLLKDLGVEQLNRTRALRIEEEGLVVEGEDGVERMLPADTVVLATGAEAESALARDLTEAGVEAAVIGDARTPRRALEAIHEGFRAGLEC